MASHCDTSHPGDSLLSRSISGRARAGEEGEAGGVLRGSGLVLYEVVHRTLTSGQPWFLPRRLQYPLVQYKGHQERGYEHRYSISASRFSGELPGPAGVCRDPRHPNTLLPLHLAPWMNLRGPCSFRGSGPCWAEGPRGGRAGCAAGRTSCAKSPWT